MAQTRFPVPPDGTRPMPRSFEKRLKEIDMFFEGRGPEHRTMRRVVNKLQKAGIDYAIVGAMAVNAHGHERTTNDVDLLLSRQGFDQFRREFVPKSYDPVPGRPRRFWDRQNGVNIDILVSGLFPGSGKPGPIRYPEPNDVCQRIESAQVVDLPTLVTLKLAARRHKDFADVVSLIRVNDLNESFQAKLHHSLHRDYIECLEEKRREDEYEARQDQAFIEATRDDPYVEEEE